MVNIIYIIFEESTPTHHPVTTLHTLHTGAIKGPHLPLQLDHTVYVICPLSISYKMWGQCVVNPRSIEREVNTLRISNFIAISSKIYPAAFDSPVRYCKESTYTAKNCQVI